MANCVCPLWRYATFPTYSSYYSKHCYDTQVSWVSYDCPDVGPNPMCLCTPDSSESAHDGMCDTCCDNRITEDKISHNLAIWPEITKYGVKGKEALSDWRAPRSFVPRLENGATLLRSELVKLILPTQSQPPPFTRDGLDVKVFVVRIQGGFESHLIGLAQETFEDFYSDPSYSHWTELTIETFEWVGPYCIRFRVARERVWHKGTPYHRDVQFPDVWYQLVTYTAIEQPKVTGRGAYRATSVCD